MTNPSLWYVDITRSGTICLYDLSTVRLWRPGNRGYRDLSHRCPWGDRGHRRKSLLTIRSPVAALDLPCAHADYRGAGNTWSPALMAPASAELNFVLLAEDYEQPDALAEALISKGCSVQLEALASTLEASDGGGRLNLAACPGAFRGGGKPTRPARKSPQADPCFVSVHRIWAAAGVLQNGTSAKKPCIGLLHRRPKLGTRAQGRKGAGSRQAGRFPDAALQAQVPVTC